MSSYLSQRVQYRDSNSYPSSSTNGDIDNVKYTNVTTTKKMAALNNSYTTVQKSGNSNTSSTYVASDYLNTTNIVNGGIKYDMQTTPSKISTHLLDHGYGATPQPNYATDDTGFKGYTKSAEMGITNYYKVNEEHYFD